MPILSGIDMSRGTDYERIDNLLSAVRRPETTIWEDKSSESTSRGLSSFRLLPVVSVAFS